MTGEHVREETNGQGAGLDDQAHHFDDEQQEPDRRQANGEMDRHQIVQYFGPCSFMPKNSMGTRITAAKPPVMMLPVIVPVPGMSRTG